MFSQLFNKIILGVFQGLPNFIKLRNWLNEVFINIQNLFTNINDYRDINKASGKLLDDIGAQYNIDRGQVDDDFYRLMIKSKIETNRGDSSINGILNTLKRALDIDITGVEITLVSGEPNAINISNIPLEWAENEFEQQYIIGRLLETVAAGIRVNSTTFVDKSNMELVITGLSSSNIKYEVKGTM